LLAFDFTPTMIAAACNALQVADFARFHPRAHDFHIALSEYET